MPDPSPHEQGFGEGTNEDHAGKARLRGTNVYEQPTKREEGAAILVLRTRSGNAQGVCEAIDTMKWPEALGSLAGENTIFIVSKTAPEAERLKQRIAEIVEG